MVESVSSVVLKQKKPLTTPSQPLSGRDAAVFTGLSSADRTGSLSEGLKAGLISYGTALAFAQVGTMAPHGIGNVMGHAAVGCVSSVAGGGECGSGAVGSLWSNSEVEFDSVAANLVAHSVEGGLSSVAAGGSFVNGAKTAAFGYLFNDLIHENTPAAKGLHRRLVVRDDSGKALLGFSFGMTDDANPYTENFSKGSSSGVPRPGGSGNGEVYIDMLDPTTKTANVFRTTAAEDQLMVNYMQSRVGQTAPYNALTNSCRDFTAAQFDYMKAEILRARSEGRDPKF